MTEHSDIVSVRLLDREYQVKCPVEKVAELQEAANYLDIKMREIGDGGKILSLDRIVVIAALNITHELVNIKKQKNYYIDKLNQRIQDIQIKIDQALAQ
jgi:cell division protein ZapA